MNRNSSFELLRLILMVMIVIHHCIVHGLGLTSFDPNWGTNLCIPGKWVFPACLSNCFCICAVNCFILISGYFGIRTNKTKIIYLLFALFFYAITLNFIPNIVEGKYINACKALLFISKSPYWFVIDYLFLMVFAPILNLAFKKLPNKDILLYTLSLLIISSYFGFVWGHAANSNGYTLFQFILMYCIGRLIRLKDFSIKKFWGIAGYILASGLCGVFMFIFWKYGFSKYAWRMTFYNNPLIIIASIFLFLVFKDLEIKSKIINSLAKSAFGIYLIQSSPFVAHFLYVWIREHAFEYANNQSYTQGGGMLIFSIIFAAIMIAAISLLIDKVRLILSKYFISSFFNIKEPHIDKPT